MEEYLAPFKFAKKATKLEKDNKKTKKDAKKVEKAKKTEKTTKIEKSGKHEKKSKDVDVIPFDDIPDDYFFGDDYYGEYCIFSYYLDDYHDDHYHYEDDGEEFSSTSPPSTDESVETSLDREKAALCLANFAENTYLDINVDEALDCNENIETIAWKSYPSCFELKYYDPQLCRGLYQEFDDFYDCFYDVFYPNPEPYCYLDDLPTYVDGCAISFSNSVGLDVDKMLNCSIDFYDQYSDICYRGELTVNSSNVCETFEECETVLYSAHYCSYYFNDKVPDIKGILEDKLEYDVLGKIYNGTFEVEEVLEALSSYDDWNVTSQNEWAEFVDCFIDDISYSFDELCFLKYESEAINGCIVNFAEAFDDLNATKLLDCTVDFEETIEEKCFGDRGFYYDYEDDGGNDDETQNVCRKLFFCGSFISEIDSCVISSLEVATSEFLNSTAMDSELSDIIPSIYDGTIDLLVLFGRLFVYSGELSFESGWQDFVGCVGQFAIEYENYDF